MITGRQIRAARALLGWDAADLAEKANISRETISNIENGATNAREHTLREIMRVFNDNDIEFTENQGVKFKSTNIEVFDGLERYDDFYDFLYDHLNRNGGDVCLSVVNERLLSKNRKNPDIHRKRMKALVDRGGVTFRILATESDFVSAYAKHRWQPKQSAAPTSFYAFGDCLALISFAKNLSPYVVVIKSGPITEAYRSAFNLAWSNAKDPDEIKVVPK